MFAEDRVERMLLICIPMLIVLLGCGASLAGPHLVMEVLQVIIAWTCTSVPVAVLVGHCALGGE